MMGGENGDFMKNMMDFANSEEGKKMMKNMGGGKGLDEDTMKKGMDMLKNNPNMMTDMMKNLGGGKGGKKGKKGGMGGMPGMDELLKDPSKMQDMMKDMGMDPDAMKDPSKLREHMDKLGLGGLGGGDDGEGGDDIMAEMM